MSTSGLHKHITHIHMLIYTRHTNTHIYLCTYTNMHVLIYTIHTHIYAKIKRFNVRNSFQ